MRDESRGLNTFQITVAESLRHRVSVGLSSDRLAGGQARSGEVRRGQARSGGSPHHRGWSVVRPLAPVLVFAVRPLCSSFKMATSARLPGQDTNCLQSSGGWRLLAVEESLAWSEAGQRMVGVSAACSCRRQLPHCPHRYIKIATLSTTARYRQLLFVLSA